MAICGLAAACGRPNPGFKLIDSSDVSDSDSQSASVGLTDTGVVTDTPTSTEVTGMTTVSGDSMSSMSSTAATGDTTTGGTESSTTMMGGHWEFPSVCPDPLDQSEEFVTAAADTFFVNEAVGVGTCTLMPEPGIDCRDMAFGGSGKFELFRTIDGNENPLDDFVSIYAVLFPRPKYEGQTLPPESFLEVEAWVRLFRPDNPGPWKVTLEARSFTPGDEWMTGEGAEFTPCHSLAASYRCRTCPAEALPVTDTCMSAWGGEDELHPDVPYNPDPNVLPVMKVPIPVAPGVDGEYVKIVLGKDRLQGVTEEGLMLMSAIPTAQQVVAVKTLDAKVMAWNPGLWVRYCTPKFVLDN